MAYMKIETSVRGNPKFLRAGPAASWLWLCGNAYCKDSLTDGFIPDEALELVGVKGARRLAGVLVRERLWERAEAPPGWHVHDWLKHNLSAEQVRDTFKEKGRRGGIASAEARRLKRGASDDRSGPLQDALSDTLQEVRSEPRTLDQDQEQDQEQARGHARRAPLIDRHHRYHAHCGRVCLPAGLFSEFVRRRGHAQADREVRDWCLEVEAAWGPDGPNAREEPGDAFAFWKARYAERWPATSSATSSSWPQRPASAR